MRRGEALSRRGRLALDAPGSVIEIQGGRSVSRVAAIRFWMGEHPRRHFASDIADGLQACGIDRMKVIKTLCDMAQTALVRVAGKRRYMPCTIGRPVRDYTLQEKEDG